MKAQVADYQTRVMCVRIVPVTGSTIRMTEYPRDLTMSNATVYLTGSGYEFTGYSATPTFSPAVLDLQGIAGFAGVSLDAIKSGVYDNARWYVFATTWNNPVEDYEPIAAGFLGKTTLKDDRYTTECIGMVDVLNQAVGKTYTNTCQKKFGGTEWAGCKKTPVVVTGTLTSVTDSATVRDNTRTEAADFFGEGTLKFTSGANAGLRPMIVKSYALDGTVITHEPFYYDPAIGDAYELTEGCRLRKSDCIAKGNILNFGGFDIPPPSVYLDRGLKS